jgi:hypothetical protein
MKAKFAIAIVDLRMMIERATHPLFEIYGKNSGKVSSTKIQNQKSKIVNPKSK